MHLKSLSLSSSLLLLSSLLCCTLTIFFSPTQANPFVGLFDTKCGVIRNGECPNKNVSFWLYTRETRDNPQHLDPLNLNPWDFRPRAPVKILLHGYTGHRDFSPNEEIRPALLDHEDLYVITVDYGPLVPYPCYFAAVENLPFVGKCLAQLVNNLVDQGIVANEDIHLIGFSLGAQVAGQTANYVKRRLKRITGLDPAKPMFITVGLDKKLDPTDAEFVDVVHTDVLGRGMLRAMGHADFYPNIGPYQPGCRDENKRDPGSCNHVRAPIYYAESIRNPNGFWSFACPTWLHFLFGVCNGTAKNDAVMGYFVNRSAHGSYFLSTAPKSPFALGPLFKTHFDDENLVQQQQDDDYEVYYNIDDIEDDYFEPELHRAFNDKEERRILTSLQKQFAKTALTPLKRRLQDRSPLKLFRPIIVF